MIFTLAVPDAHRAAQRLTGRGAETVIPVDDRYRGYREGRPRDPHGHVWIVSQHLDDLDPDQIQGRTRIS